MIQGLMITSTVLMTAVRHIQHSVSLQVQLPAGRAVLQKLILVLLQLVKQSAFEIHFNIILPHRPTSSKWLFLWLPSQSRKSAPPTLPDTCLAPFICLIWSRDSYSVSSTNLHIKHLSTFPFHFLLLRPTCPPQHPVLLSTFQLDKRRDGFQSRSLLSGERKLFGLSGFEPRFVQSTACELHQADEGIVSKCGSQGAGHLPY